MAAAAVAVAVQEATQARVPVGLSTLVAVWTKVAAHMARAVTETVLAPSNKVIIAPQTLWDWGALKSPFRNRLPQEYSQSLWQNRSLRHPSL